MNGPPRATETKKGATNLRVHDIRGHVCISDVFSKFAAQISLDLFEVQRCHRSPWAAVDSGLVPNNLSTQWLWEASHRLPKIALEELNNRRGKIKLICTGEHVLFGEGVRCHPLCKVTNHLGRWRNFNNVTALKGE